jgi:hypothetical protein
MTTDTVFLPNLWFEDELSGAMRRPPHTARQTVDALAAVVPLLEQLRDTKEPGNIRAPGRTICVTNALPEGVPPALQHVQYMTLSQLARLELQSPALLPWGWSQQACDVARILSIAESQLPDLQSVRLVNSRRFQAVVAASDVSGDGVPKERLCHTIEDCRSAVRDISEQATQSWVMKAEFSAAGRNRITGSGNQIAPTAINWLQSRFGRDECVLVEPWLDVVQECGLQFSISSVPASADADAGTGQTSIRCDGITELLTAANGQYLGSVLAPEDSHHESWLQAVEHGHRIAAQAAAVGYRGPLGIDCMLYRDRRGVEFLRVGHDINGRQTMGRIALACSHQLAPDRWLAWLCLGPAKFVALQKSVSKTASTDVKLLRTSPERVAGQSVQVITAALCASNHSELLKLIR